MHKERICENIEDEGGDMRITEDGSTSFCRRKKLSKRFMVELQQLLKDSELELRYQDQRWIGFSDFITYSWILGKIEKKSRRFLFWNIVKEQFVKWIEADLGEDWISYSPRLEIKIYVHSIENEVESLLKSYEGEGCVCWLELKTANGGV